MGGISIYSMVGAHFIWISTLDLITISNFSWYFDHNSFNIAPQCWPLFSWTFTSLITDLFAVYCSKCQAAPYKFSTWEPTVLVRLACELAWIESYIGEYYIMECVMMFPENYGRTSYEEDCPGCGCCHPVSWGRLGCQLLERMTTRMWPLISMCAYWYCYSHWDSDPTYSSHMDSLKEHSRRFQVFNFVLELNQGLFSCWVFQLLILSGFWSLR